MFGQDVEGTERSVGTCGGGGEGSGKKEGRYCQYDDEGNGWRRSGEDIKVWGREGREKGREGGREGGGMREEEGERREEEGGVRLTF